MGRYTTGNEETVDTDKRSSYRRRKPFLRTIHTGGNNTDTITVANC